MTKAIDVKANMLNLHYKILVDLEAAIVGSRHDEMVVIVNEAASLGNANGKTCLRFVNVPESFAAYTAKMIAKKVKCTGADGLPVYPKAVNAWDFYNTKISQINEMITILEAV